VLTHT
jgi:hypothetical protein